MIFSQCYVLTTLCLTKNNDLFAFTPTIPRNARTTQRMMTVKPTEEPTEEPTERSDLPKDFASIIQTEKESLDNFFDQNAISTNDDYDHDYQYDQNIPALDQQIGLSLIDNEITLQEFIKEINMKDKGMLPKPKSTNDFGKLASILMTKAWDTVEDANLMFRRKLKESSYLESLSADSLAEWNDPSLAHKPRLLVIGSGWSSHAFVKVIDTEKYRVLNVSPINYFVFTPMLASSSVGTTEIRSIVESVHTSNPTVRFLEGAGLHVNVEMQQMRIKLGEGCVVESYMDDDQNIIDNALEVEKIIDIEYDMLVYAAGVGPISSSVRTPGLSQENVHFLKSITDAQRLRSSMIDLLEKASQPNISEDERRRLLTFVVVGGGPTGTEYTGELNDFLLDVTGSDRGRGRMKKNIAPFASLSPYTRVILIQGADELLPQFDEDLRLSAKQSLEDVGVEVLTSTRVSSIESSEQLTISSYDVDGKNNEKVIKCGIIVWGGGTKPVKLTEQLISNTDEYFSKYNLGTEGIPSSMSVAGRIPVDRYLRVLGTPPGTVLAIGDAAITVGEDATNLPQTAQVAAQQGAYAARLLNRGCDLTGCIDERENTVEKKKKSNPIFLDPPIHIDAIDGDTGPKLWTRRGAMKAKPFEFLNLGQLAYIGGGKALSQVQLGDKHLFNQAGSIGFLLWRSVYVVKQVSTKTRLLVLFDWFKTKIFGRDVTRM
mmetsp:Transcript_32782/g.38185  ORF Transcript_32782/g.38185 Transcript_32782/m.38185 type:complete len:713 (+) Transcript_32782:38-2176(+)